MPLMELERRVPSFEIDRYQRWCELAVHLAKRVVQLDQRGQAGICTALLWVDDGFDRVGQVGTPARWVEDEFVLSVQELEQWTCEHIKGYRGRDPGTYDPGSPGEGSEPQHVLRSHGSCCSGAYCV